MLKVKPIFYGALSALVLGDLAFVVGLILQNQLFPSAVTAASVWLIYLTPLVSVVSVVVGFIIGFLQCIRVQYPCTNEFARAMIMVLGFFAGLFAAWQHYWLVTLLVWLAAWGVADVSRRFA